jgi:hypothetical protein
MEPKRGQLNGKTDINYNLHNELSKRWGKDIAKGVELEMK